MRNVEVFDSCFDAYKRIQQSAGNARTTDLGDIVLNGRGSARQFLPGASDYLADFEVLGLRALEGYLARVFLFHYVGLEDAESVRKALAVSPQTFDAWRDQVRHGAGGAFRRGGLWPRQRYFRIYGNSAIARFWAEIEACE